MIQGVVFVLVIIGYCFLFAGIGWALVKTGFIDWLERRM